MIVTVDTAVEAERPIVEALFQLYSHDFSEIEPEDSPRLLLDQHGRFAPYAYMDSYWREPDRRPTLIRADGRLAGFALVNTYSHRGARIDWAVAEFFVVRRYRRRGLASRAAGLLFNAQPGRWELAVAERNIAAQHFWPAAIRASDVSQISSAQGDGQLWTGTIWSFVSAGA